MPRRSWLVRVRDMLRACEAVVAFTDGMNVEQFAADRRTIDAVIRNLEVVGEAARHVPDAERRRFPDVPWQDVADMRNVLVHEYFGVDLDILWQTATVDIPDLIPILNGVLASVAEE